MRLKRVLEEDAQVAVKSKQDCRIDYASQTYPVADSNSSEPSTTYKSPRKRKLRLEEDSDTPSTQTHDVNDIIPDDDSSDEEKLKTLKRRATLEQQESRANREHREKWEQKNVNDKFFRGRKHGDKAVPDDEEKNLQELINTDLLNPLTASNNNCNYEEDPLAQKQNKIDLPVPGCKETADYEEWFNPKIDQEFVNKFKLGLIREPNTEPEKSPYSPKHSYSRRGSRNAHVWNFFDRQRWSEAESELFRELLATFGCNWTKISSLLMTKTPHQLEEFYLQNRYDLSCELCGTSSDDKLLLLCDGCDRPYHTYCLIPPLKEIPSTAWYCSKECETIHEKHCESCLDAGDEQKMLLCDMCDKGYHVYCLVPPLDKVPDGDWICETCKKNGISKKCQKKSKKYQKKRSSPRKTSANDVQLSLKITPRAEDWSKKIATTAKPSLTYADLKHWVAMSNNPDQIVATEKAYVRDNNLTTLIHKPIFRDLAIEVDVKSLNDHFLAVLLAVEKVVDRMHEHPVFPSKVIPNKSPKKEKKNPVDDDGFSNEPRSWIFQANSSLYDIVSSVKSLKTMTWFVKQHIYKIKAGDRVYIWVSGKDGKLVDFICRNCDTLAAGALALGTILTDPAEIPEAKGMQAFTLASKLFNTVQLRCFLRIDYTFPRRLEKSAFVANPETAHLTILRQPIGTNFKLTKAEAVAVENMVKREFGKDLSTVTQRMENEGGGNQAEVETHTGDTLGNAMEANNSSSKPTSPNGNKVFSTSICENCSVIDVDNIVKCHECHQAFHFYCVNPPLKAKPESPWVCTSCGISPEQLLHTKLNIGYKELHLQSRRIIQNQCEDCCVRHRKNMLQGTNSKKVVSQLKSLTKEIGTFKEAVMDAANTMFDQWRDALVEKSRRI